ncbi:hypothetical protein [Arthrobacter sp. ok362]|uniref:hypothetical protein n=1 Tax=Arthrobacter sp. ok362 TaxID=1761745 RepID=UPI000890A189|nr:hypothetical protein [Arthrobacter sp. ok362]SDK43276.1 hypothetical protein SAMN04487913_101211 [Arthrobacter sp. ok362]
MKPLEVVRAAYGMSELLAPDFVSGRLLGEAPDGRARAVIRVLGARHLLQAVLTARAGRTAHRVGGSVDAVHAASMIVLAALDGRHRRSAAANAALALVFAAGEFK